MQCSKCHRDAIVFQPYSGLHLCDQHLITDVEAKAKKIIRAQGWLRPGDHIAVLLSGTRSSGALLFFLKKLTAQRRDIRISAMTIEEETGSCGDTSHTKRIAERLDTELLQVSWPAEYRPWSEAGREKNQNISSLSSPISRSMLPDRIAYQLGITKIAWGLCLDDAAGRVLESVLRGEGENLVRGSTDHDTLPRICPFISVPAAEVSLYADHYGLGNELTSFTDPGDKLHRDTIAMLDGFVNNHPATKYALLNLGESLGGFTGGIAGIIRVCELYGEYQQRSCNCNSKDREAEHDAY